MDKNRTRICSNNDKMKACSENGSAIEPPWNETLKAKKGRPKQSWRCTVTKKLENIGTEDVE